MLAFEVMSGAGLNALEEADLTVVLRMLPNALFLVIGRSPESTELAVPLEVVLAPVRDASGIEGMSRGEDVCGLCKESVPDLRWSVEAMIFMS